jgi:hypothetical protein
VGKWMSFLTLPTVAIREYNGRYMTGVAHPGTLGDVMIAD